MGFFLIMSTLSILYTIRTVLSLVKMQGLQLAIIIQSLLSKLAAKPAQLPTTEVTPKVWPLESVDPY